MKFFAGIAFLLTITSAFGQLNPLQNRHGAGNGDGSDETGKVYLARVPYTLNWRTEKRYNLYDGNPQVKAETFTAGVRVFDAMTNNIIASGPVTGTSGSFRVPSAGKHYVKVYSTGKWSAAIVEDAELLRKAQAEGKLKPGVAVEDYESNRVTRKTKMKGSPLYGGADQPSTVRSATELAIIHIKDKNSPKAEDDIHWIHVAAARSSNVAEFEQRVRALAPHLFSN